MTKSKQSYKTEKKMSQTGRLIFENIITKLPLYKNLIMIQKSVAVIERVWNWHYGRVIVIWSDYMVDFSGDECMIFFKMQI